MPHSDQQHRGGKSACGMLSHPKCPSWFSQVHIDLAGDRDHTDDGNGGEESLETI